MTNGHVINRAAVRHYLLEQAEAKRPTAGFSRVSGELLDDIEAEFRTKLRRLVETVPSNGKTIKR